MAKDQVIAVKDAVHKLQLWLLEGIQDEDKLFAAGSLMSRSDYQDVVTERSIANLCGYPLCGNTLPSERPRKGRYRISLKEHKVYDLHETHMYCSTSCVVNSRAFAASLQEERCSSLNPGKLNEVLRLFEGLGLEDSKRDKGKNSNLGSSKLRIQEKTDTSVGEVSLEEWIGPSDAIEGYVPQKNSSSKMEQPKNLDKGRKSEHAQIHPKKDNFFSEMDFSSTLIIQDEYSVSKSPDPTKSVSGRKTDKHKGKVKQKDMKDQSIKSEGRVASMGQKAEKEGKKSDRAERRTFVNDNLGDLSNDMHEKLIILDSSSGPSQNDLNRNASEAASELEAEKPSTSTATLLKSSLKSTMRKRETRSVSWADEKTDGNSSKSLCEFRELEDKKDTSSQSEAAIVEADEVDSYRFASAEACARALTEAAEAVASGDSDVSDAVAEAGIIVLPPPREACESEAQEKVDMVDSEINILKWPMKPGLSNSDLSDSDDSWYDSPPEGFSLNLSPFATMFMALFAWVSSSSLAYIYGHDESHHEDYLFINGREYPRKIFSADGRSLEIKQALAGCLAQALPGLVADLRLPMPLSTLEKEMDHLLDTMSFMDPLPPFRMKQWQLVVLLFLDALSVCRIPALTPYMTGRRILLPKVLDCAQMSAEEYEIMKDLIIPLGRVPQFAMQSGA